jgi:hypothetical protein
VNDKKHLDIVGYDNVGNIFSGLDGFRFDWSIVSGDKHLKFINKPDGYKKKRVNESTDIAYVKGLTPGEAQLKVRVFEPGYETIKPAEVYILVIDPFIIEPQRPVYILPTSAFVYKLTKLAKMDNGDMSRLPISLPNQQYEWSNQDHAVGRIHQDGKFISDKTEGRSLITVTDKKNDNNTDEVMIRVVLPYRISMQVFDVSDFEQVEIDDENGVGEFGTPLGNATESKILVEERLYLIVLSLFDKDNNRIEITENLEFDSSGLLDQECIQKVKVSKTGSQILFKTNKIERKLAGNLLAELGFGKKLPTSY